MVKQKAKHGMEDGARIILPPRTDDCHHLEHKMVSIMCLPTNGRSRESDSIPKNDRV